jgi:hypothetical protein
VTDFQDFSTYLTEEQWQNQQHEKEGSSP